MSTTTDNADSPQNEALLVVEAESALPDPHDKLKRRGDVSKCPVCGSGIDPEAYHCALCRNYFCYHCRARLLHGDEQFRCLNQGCDYYAKLICGVCDPPHDKDEPPSVYAEPEDGYWPALLVTSLIVSGLTWYNSSSLLAGFLTFVGLYLCTGYGMQRFGFNIFGSTRNVVHNRSSSFHSCVACQQAVKEVASSS